MLLDDQWSECSTINEEYCIQYINVHNQSLISGILWWRSNITLLCMPHGYEKTIWWVSWSYVHVVLKSECWSNDMLKIVNIRLVPRPKHRYLCTYGSGETTLCSLLFSFSRLIVAHIYSTTYSCDIFSCFSHLLWLTHSETRLHTSIWWSLGKQYRTYQSNKTTLHSTGMVRRWHGKFCAFRSLWDRVVSQVGPTYGYFPNPSKTCVLVKEKKKRQHEWSRP